MLLQFTKSGITTVLDEIRPGRWKGLTISGAVTMDTGDDLELETYTFRVRYNGEPIYDIPGRFARQLNNERFGGTVFNNTQGGAGRFSIHLPFWFYNQPNSLEIEPNDQLVVEILDTNGADYAARQLSVHAHPGDAPQYYIPVLGQWNQSLAGAGTLKERIQHPNIASVWLYAADPSDVINVQVTREGVLKADGTLQQLIDNTTNMFRFDDAATASEYARVNMGGGLDSLVSQSVDFSITTDAAEDIAVQYLAFRYDQRKTAVSQAKVEKEVSARLGAVEAVRSDDVAALGRVERSSAVYADEAV